MYNLIRRKAGLVSTGKKIFLATIIFLAAGCSNSQTLNTAQPKPVACTQEAKQCPDGSFVGRGGPACEFAECPSPATPPPVIVPIPSPQAINSGIVGNIVLGPTCPVMRNPPDPVCADKPYQATIIVKSANGQKEITRFTSKADGSFKVALVPATYLLVPVSPSIYPRGLVQSVVVEKNKFTNVVISYDSGIR